MIKRLIIALALGTGILFTANAQNSAVKDSLLRIYVTAPHDSMRLDVLHDIARLDQQTPVFLYYENKLLKEATEQNNLRYQSLATYEHIIYFFNKLDLKRVTQWMNRMEVLAEKHNYYNDYFKAKKLQIEMYTINQQIELAIHEANIMYDKAKKLNDSNGMREACLCLMTSYIATLRYEDGAKALEEAFHLMSPQDRPMDKINLLSKAVLAYSFLHNNEKMYASLEQMKVAIQDLITATPHSRMHTQPYIWEWKLNTPFTMSARETPRKPGNTCKKQMNIIPLTPSCRTEYPVCKLMQNIIVPEKNTKKPWSHWIMPLP